MKHRLYEQVQTFPLEQAVQTLLEHAQETAKQLTQEGKVHIPASCMKTEGQQEGVSYREDRGENSMVIRIESEKKPKIHCSD